MSKWTATTSSRTVWELESLWPITTTTSGVKAKMKTNNCSIIGIVPKPSPSSTDSCNSACKINVKMDSNDIVQNSRKHRKLLANRNNNKRSGIPRRARTAFTQASNSKSTVAEKEWDSDDMDSTTTLKDVDPLSTDPGLSPTSLFKIRDQSGKSNPPSLGTEAERRGFLLPNDAEPSPTPNSLFNLQSDSNNLQTSTRRKEQTPVCADHAQNSTSSSLLNHNQLSPKLSPLKPRSSEKEPLSTGPSSIRGTNSSFSKQSYLSWKTPSLGLSTDAEVQRHNECNDNRRFSDPHVLRGRSVDKESCHSEETENADSMERGISIEVDPPFIESECGRLYATFQTQVAATDILADEGQQTGDSLAGRCPGLPPRYPGRVCGKSGRKCPDAGCDYPWLRLPSGGEGRNVQMQVCTGDICPSQESQTEPCLEADGPICPWDYRLKKIRYTKGDCYEDCVPRKQVKEDRSYYKHCANEVCLQHFQNQVRATDINVTDWVQTEESLLERPPFQPGCVGETTRSRRWKCRKLSLESCECPFLERAHPPVEHCTQVNATDICPTREAQTGDSLILGGKVMKAKYRRRLSDVDSLSPRFAAISGGRSAQCGTIRLKIVQTQVTALDICHSTCCQTGESVADLESGVSRKSCRREDGVLIARPRHINYLDELGDSNAPRWLTCPDLCPGERSTQVEVKDICQDQGTQTADGQDQISTHMAYDNCSGNDVTNNMHLSPGDSQSSKVVSSDVNSPGGDCAQSDSHRRNGAWLNNANSSGPKVTSDDVNTVRINGAKIDSVKVDSAQIGAANINGAKVDIPKVDIPKVDSALVGAAKVEGTIVDGPRVHIPYKKRKRKNDGPDVSVQTSSPI